MTQEQLSQLGKTPGSHAPAWEHWPTLQRRVSYSGRWSVRAAFPRRSVGTRKGP